MKLLIIIPFLLILTGCVSRPEVVRLRQYQAEQQGEIQRLAHDLEKVQNICERAKENK